MNLLLSLRSAGLTVRVDGGKLIVSPGEKLTPGQREAIKANKAALIVAVAGESEVLRDRLWQLMDQAHYALADLYHLSQITGSAIPMEEAAKALLDLCPGSRAGDFKFRI